MINPVDAATSRSGRVGRRPPSFDVAVFGRSMDRGRIRPLPWLSRPAKRLPLSSAGWRKRGTISPWRMSVLMFSQVRSLSSWAFPARANRHSCDVCHVLSNRRAVRSGLAERTCWPPASVGWSKYGARSWGWCSRASACCRTSMSSTMSHFRCACRACQPADRTAKAREMIELVGLDGRENSMPHELSGRSAAAGRHRSIARCRTRIMVPRRTVLRSRSADPTPDAGRVLAPAAAAAERRLSSSRTISRRPFAWRIGSRSCVKDGSSRSARLPIFCSSRSTPTLRGSLRRCRWLES